MWLTLLILMFVVLVPVTYPLISDFGAEFAIFRYLFHINLLSIGILLLSQYIYADKKGFFSDFEDYNYKKRTALFFPINRIHSFDFILFFSHLVVVLFIFFTIYR